MRDFVTQTTFIKKKLLATQNDIFLVPVKQFGAEIRKKKSANIQVSIKHLKLFSPQLWANIQLLCYTWIY